jgi:hypothetical protein
MADIEGISDQLGFAVVNATTGAAVKSGGDLEGDETTISRLYQIFVDSVRSIGDESFHRVSITFGTYSYVMTIGDDKNVYIHKASAL